MKIGIITVGYRSGGFIGELLESLAAQTDTDFKLYLVNNSQDDAEEIETLAGTYAFPEYIANAKNAGYAGGNNLGMARAFAQGCDWVLLLNPDTQVSAEFVADLKHGLSNKHGLVGLPIREPAGTVYGGSVQWLKEELSQNHTMPEEDFYIHGGAMCVQRAAYEKLGPMDENYFLYFEDADYSVVARRAGIAVSYLEKPELSHRLSASTKALGSATVLRYHVRNALYFNWKLGPDRIKVLASVWSLYILLKQAAKLVIDRDRKISTAMAKGVFDMYLNKMGRLPDAKLIRVGIECESIEGKNPMWGVGRIILKLLEGIAARPELAERYQFVLYFKDSIPDLPVLNAPIFEKKITPVPGGAGRLFPFYYYALLPIKLWFEELHLMFWPNYMLPIIAFGKSLVFLTEDVYYESHEGQLPFRYRLAYGIFGEWTARFANRIMAISETSKKQIVQLYEIDERRIAVDHLGIDIGAERAESSASDYVLYVGQAFPRRHLRETILAFEKIAPEFPNLKLIAVGPDKYEKPIIASLVSEVNKKLSKQAIEHKDYVSDAELVGLYAGAKALIYVSDREAFGLPPMEAMALGVPPVVADNELGHELFGDYAFYAKTGSTSDIADALRAALTDTAKQERIRHHAPAFAKQYTWERFTERWLQIVSSLTI